MIGYPAGKVHLRHRLTAISVLVTFTLFSLLEYAPVATASLRGGPAGADEANKRTNNDLIASAPSDPLPRNEGIFVPLDLGSIKETHRGREDSKTIFYIQDAHASLEAQENIAKIVQRLVREHNVRTVFEEGYEGEVPTEEFFGFIPDFEMKEKVAHFLMDKLRISGAEYAHILAPSDFKLIGADSLELHKKNISWYQKSAKLKARTNRDLDELLSHLRKLGNRFFPKELKTWIKLKDRYDAGKLDLVDYLNRCKALIVRPSLSLRSPSNQMHGLKQSLPGRQAGPEIASTLFGTLSRNYNVVSYPLISLILAAESSKNEALITKLNSLDSKALFREIETLERDLADQYLRNERDTQIFTYYSGLMRLKRLNEIEMTPSEYEAARKTLNTLNTRALADFIVEHSRKTLVVSRVWEEMIQSALKFYETALARDNSIATRLSEFAQNQDEDTAILVFGGFHKQNIRQILKANNFSYVIIAPKISGSSKKHEDYYKRLMTVGHHPFELAAQVATAARAESTFAMATGRAEVRAVQEAMLKFKYESPLIGEDSVINHLENRTTSSRPEVRTTEELDGEALRFAYQVDKLNSERPTDMILAERIRSNVARASANKFIGIKVSLRQAKHQRQLVELVDLFVFADRMGGRERNQQQNKANAIIALFVDSETEMDVFLLVKDVFYRRQNGLFRNPDLIKAIHSLMPSGWDRPEVRNILVEPNKSIEATLGPASLALRRTEGRAAQQEQLEPTPVQQTLRTSVSVGASLIPLALVGFLRAQVFGNGIFTELSAFFVVWAIGMGILGMIRMTVPSQEKMVKLAGLPFNKWDIVINLSFLLFQFSHLVSLFINPGAAHYQSITISVITLFPVLIGGGMYLERWKRKLRAEQGGTFENFAGVDTPKGWQFATLILLLPTLDLLLKVIGLYGWNATFHSEAEFFNSPFVYGSLVVMQAVVALMLYWSYKGKPWPTWAAISFGGATANVIEQYIWGGAIDPIPGIRSAYNAADLMIMISNLYLGVAFGRTLYRALFPRTPHSKGSKIIAAVKAWSNELIHWSTKNERPKLMNLRRIKSLPAALSAGAVFLGFYVIPPYFLAGKYTVVEGRIAKVQTEFASDMDRLIFMVGRISASGMDDPHIQKLYADFLSRPEETREVIQGLYELDAYDNLSPMERTHVRMLEDELTDHSSARPEVRQTSAKFGAPLVLDQGKPRPEVREQQSKAAERVKPRYSLESLRRTRELLDLEGDDDSPTRHQLEKDLEVFVTAAHERLDRVTRHPLEIFLEKRDGMLHELIEDHQSEITFTSFWKNQIIPRLKKGGEWQGKKRVLIVLSGTSSGGKTTAAYRLMEMLQRLGLEKGAEVYVIAKDVWVEMFDHFLTPPDERDPPGTEDPYLKFDWEAFVAYMKLVKQNKLATAPTYDQATKGRIEFGRDDDSKLAIFNGTQTIHIARNDDRSIRYRRVETPLRTDGKRPKPKKLNEEKCAVGTTCEFESGDTSIELKPNEDGTLDISIRNKMSSKKQRYVVAKSGNSLLLTTEGLEHENPKRLLKGKRVRALQVTPPAPDLTTDNSGLQIVIPEGILALQFEGADLSANVNLTLWVRARRFIQRLKDWGHTDPEYLEERARIFFLRHGTEGLAIDELNARVQQNPKRNQNHFQLTGGTVAELLYRRFRYNSVTTKIINFFGGRRIFVETLEKLADEKGEKGLLQWLKDLSKLSQKKPLEHPTPLSPNAPAEPFQTAYERYWEGDMITLAAGHHLLQKGQWNRNKKRLKLDDDAIELFGNILARSDGEFAGSQIVNQEGEPVWMRVLNTPVNKAKWDNQGAWKRKRSIEDVKVYRTFVTDQLEYLGERLDSLEERREQLLTAATQLKKEAKRSLIADTKKKRDDAAVMETEAEEILVKVQGTAAERNDNRERRGLLLQFFDGQRTMHERGMFDEQPDAAWRHGIGFYRGIEKVMGVATRSYRFDNEALESADRIASEEDSADTHWQRMQDKYGDIPGFDQLEGYQRRYVGNAMANDGKGEDYLKKIPEAYRAAFVQEALRMPKNQTELKNARFGKVWNVAVSKGEEGRFKNPGVSAVNVVDPQIGFLEGIFAQVDLHQLLVEFQASPINPADRVETTPQQAWAKEYVGSLARNERSALYLLSRAFLDSIVENYQWLEEVRARSGKDIAQLVDEIYQQMDKKVEEELAKSGTRKPKGQDWEHQTFRDFIEIALTVMPDSWDKWDELTGALQREYEANPPAYRGTNEKVWYQANDAAPRPARAEVRMPDEAEDMQTETGTDDPSQPTISLLVEWKKLKTSDEHRTQKLRLAIENPHVAGMFTDREYVGELKGSGPERRAGVRDMYNRAIDFRDRSVFHLEPGRGQGRIDYPGLTTYELDRLDTFFESALQRLDVRLRNVHDPTADISLEHRLYGLSQPARRMVHRLVNRDNQLTPRVGQGFKRSVNLVPLNSFRLFLALAWDVEQREFYLDAAEALRLDNRHHLANHEFGRRRPRTLRGYRGHLTDEEVDHLQGRFLRAFNELKNLVQNELIHRPDALNRLNELREGSGITPRSTAQYLDLQALRNWNVEYEYKRRVRAAKKTDTGRKPAKEKEITRQARGRLHTASRDLVESMIGSIGPDVEVPVEVGNMSAAQQSQAPVMIVWPAKTGGRNIVPADLRAITTLRSFAKYLTEHPNMVIYDARVYPNARQDQFLRIRILFSELEGALRQIDGGWLAGATFDELEQEIFGTALPVLQSYLGFSFFTPVEVDRPDVVIGRQLLDLWSWFDKGSNRNYRFGEAQRRLSNFMTVYRSTDWDRRVDLAQSWLADLAPLALTNKAAAHILGRFRRIAEEDERLANLIPAERPTLEGLAVFTTDYLKRNEDDVHHPEVLRALADKLDGFDILPHELEIVSSLLGFLNSTQIQRRKLFSPNISEKAVVTFLSNRQLHSRILLATASAYIHGIHRSPHFQRRTLGAITVVTEEVKSCFSAFVRWRAKTRATQTPRAEVRLQAVEEEELDIEDLQVPAVTILSAAELGKIGADEKTEELTDLLTLAQRHKAHDIYIDGDADLSDHENPLVRALVKEDRVKPLRAASELKDKRIVVQMSFFEEQDAGASVASLKDQYGIRGQVLALGAEAGALPAFLIGVESSLKSLYEKGEVIAEEIDERVLSGIAQQGEGKRWWVHEYLCSEVRLNLRADYIIAIAA